MYMTYFLKALVFIFCLAVGSNVSADSIRMAEIFLEQPVESDDPDALVLLATKYEHAEGVQQDAEKALELYCKAAKLDHADAHYALGWMYANGRSVPRDDGVAAQLFAMAAERGHVHAEKVLRYFSTSTESALPDCLQSEIGTEDFGSSIDYSGYPVFELVSRLAPHYEIDPDLVMAVISVESGFNAMAVSPKNAQGLMQLIPETASRFQVKDSFDPEDNIKGGMAYLRWLLAFFKGDVTLVAAAYNAGEGAVEKYKGIPPYPETKDYVKKIQERYTRSTHPYQPDIVHRHALITMEDIN